MNGNVIVRSRINVGISLDQDGEIREDEWKRNQTSEFEDVEYP